MTHLYIKICDLCGKPCEAGSQMHVSQNKVSTSVFREEFDICVLCLKNTGLFEILKSMKEQKLKNHSTEITAKKLIARATGHNPTI